MQPTAPKRAAWCSAVQPWRVRRCGHTPLLRKKLDSM